MKLHPANITILRRLLVGRSSRPLLSIISRLADADLAILFTHLNERESLALLNALIELNKAAEVLSELPESRLQDLLIDLEDDRLLRIIKSASPSQAAYILQSLPEDRCKAFMEQMEWPTRRRIQQFLDYPEDSAGRMMQTDFFSLPSHISAGEGLDLLRQRAKEQSIYYIYNVNEEGQLIGVVSLRLLATTEPSTPLHQIVKREVVSVHPETPANDVARLVAHYDFIAIPVVDHNKKLIGIVTVDDVVDLIQEQAVADLYAQAGLQEDDRVYTKIGLSLRYRLPWMFVNLCLAAVASSVVSFFEDTMSQLIVLASLKNIVAAIGGNTAIQTSTVVTRGLATGDFQFTSIRQALIKETFVGLSLGLTTGFGAAILTYLWKNDLLVSSVMLIAMVLNSLVAASCGAAVPILLKRMRWDPAVGSGPVVTMITDIFGFFSFLGIARIGLYWIGH